MTILAIEKEARKASRRRYPGGIKEGAQDETFSTPNDICAPL
jgi:hypothetical protein